MAATEGETIEAQGAVSFVVSFNDCPPKQRRLPKGLTARREQRQAKASLTGQSIAEKQRRAEERREKLKEEKLERLHQLEEEMAGLARKIQAHEAVQSSTKPLHPPTDSEPSQEGDGHHNMVNGVDHHPE